MTGQRRRALLIVGLCALACLNLAQFVGVPPLLQVFAVVVLTGIFWISGELAAVSVTLSLAVFVLLANATISLTGLDKSIYWRPYEMLEIRHDEWGKIYRPKSDVSMLQPFGDLKAMSTIGHAEPRQVRFVTDSLGFRNSADYHGQSLVLIGDSFVAGEANTQACVLTDILRTRHGLDTYNLGHSGDALHDYLNHLTSFEKKYGSSFRAALFVYEGNDFIPWQATRYPPTNPWRDFFREFALWKYTHSLYIRLFKPGNDWGMPVTHPVAGMTVGFMSAYRDVVLRNEPYSEEAMRWEQALAPHRARIAHIYFVPDKFRVLAPLFDSGRIGTLPDRQWQYLEMVATKLGIPATNLTPALAEAAQSGAPQGQLPFWRDDTHWNCAGASAAARVVASQLPGGKP